MKVIDWITKKMGLGYFIHLKFEVLSTQFNNMTLGIHGQEWEAKGEESGKDVAFNEIYIGFLFFRFILGFVQPEGE